MKKLEAERGELLLRVQCQVETVARHLRELTTARGRNVELVELNEDIQEQENKECYQPVQSRQRKIPEQSVAIVNHMRQGM